MKKLGEKIIYAGLVLIVTLVIIALVTQIQALIYAAFAILMACSIAFTVVQMVDYLGNKQQTNKKSQLWFMIVSIIVSLAIIALSIFVFSGRLLAIY